MTSQLKHDLIHLSLSMIEQRYMTLRGQNISDLDTQGFFPLRSAILLKVVEHAMTTYVGNNASGSTLGDKQYLFLSIIDERKSFQTI